MRAYLTETIGTFFLVLTIGLSVMGGSPMAPLAIGASLMVMVYMGWHISGGHYNPAVTLAVALRRQLPMPEVLKYWVSQLVGATLGAFAAYVIMNRTFAPAPGFGVTSIEAIAVEFFYTFALCLVVLQTRTSSKTTGNQYYGLAIGFTVVVAAFAGGGVSGGAFNPAVGFGPTLIYTIFGHGTMRELWIYIVGPFLGALASVAVFKLQGDDA